MGFFAASHLRRQLNCVTRQFIVSFISLHHRVLELPLLFLHVRERYLLLSFIWVNSPVRLLSIHKQIPDHLFITSVHQVFSQRNTAGLTVRWCRLSAAEHPAQFSNTRLSTKGLAIVFLFFFFFFSARCHQWLPACSWAASIIHLYYFVKGIQRPSAPRLRLFITTALPLCHDPSEPIKAGRSQLGKEPSGFFILWICFWETFVMFVSVSWRKHHPEVAAASPWGWACFCFIWV